MRHLKSGRFIQLKDETINECKRRLYREWKAAGLCVICGLRPKSPTNLRCAHCRPSREQYRRQLLRTFYGITLEQYNALLLLQNGNCATCGEYLTDPHVDHDHATNKLRGLLCKKCNTALAMVNDNITLLGKLIEYLKGFQN